MIFVVGESAKEIEAKLQAALNKLEDWLDENKLKMNANKTKYMIIRNNRKQLSREIRVNTRKGNELERVTIMKYLGVILDEHLTFKEHCDYILKKVGKKTSFLNRIGNHISAYTRCLVYKTIIAPHFEYCATIMINMGKTELEKLQKAQNRAMRTILQVNRYTRIRDMLVALSFMSIKERLEFNVSVFMYKLVNGMVPNELSSGLELVGDRMGVRTRQAENIKIDFRKTTSAQHSLMYAGVKMYNDLPDKVKSAADLFNFKKDIKEYILGKR
ncbi:PREDICTED: RNA-directed DNA polymerase from mobile element jockey-like [Vollenhovia emeryi]|uniref:RNA-directed DNA polymerase from mobile element jockey-like n=1 Tax=Vollenhovia emeryi TaxID=411798 RepID=UPI0005F3743B|nr:PREDICTED: RNA-directed DNA polymerase from mobile element jockey-like [Vollenhovia emeryi]